MGKTREGGDWVECDSICKSAKCAVSKAILNKFDKLNERLGKK